MAIAKLSLTPNAHGTSSGEQKFERPLMKTKIFATLTLTASCIAALAQTNQSVDDWKPAPSNMPGQQYPQVNSEGRVRARLPAPLAQKVQHNISGIKFLMTKGIT
jgi:hypothetical protein